jgi:type II secretory pathway predicted ATPase ExeA
MDAGMKHGYFAIALALVLSASPTLALELKTPESDNRGLRIELEVVPTPLQKNFEEYIQELVASAQQDAKEANSKREEDITKEKQPKTLNPLVLFRW